MSKWTNDKCGYCDHEATDLDRYECPECQRAGCPTCMPTGNESLCDQCIESKDWERKVLGQR